MTVGTGDRNEGVITFNRNASTLISIQPNRSVSQSGHATIPSTWTKGAVLTRSWAGLATKNSASAIIQAQIRQGGEDGTPWVSTVPVSITSSGGYLESVPGSARILQPGTDINITISDLDTNATGVAAGADLVRILDKSAPQ